MKIPNKQLWLLPPAAYLLLKLLYHLSGDITASIGDGTVYMYMAREVLMGATPYMDFHFAHPPLLLYLAAFFFRLFGASLLIGSLVPILSGLAIVMLTYLLGEKIKPGTGLIASLLTALSLHIQLTTNWLSGAGLCLALVLASAYLLLSKKEFAGGILLAVSFLARLSFLPLAVALLLYSLYKRNYRFLYGLAVTIPPLLLLLLIPNFIQSVFTSHFMEFLPGMAILMTGYTGFVRVFLGQLGIFALGAAALYLLRKEIGQLKHWDILPFLILAALPYLLLKEVYYWYLLFLIPAFSIACSIFLSHTKNRSHWLAIFTLLLIITAYPTLSDISSKSKSGYTLALSPLEAELAPGTPIFDTSSATGAYLALKTGARIVGQIDMNGVGIATGFFDTGKIVSNLEADRPLYIIDRRGHLTGEQINRPTYWWKTPIRLFIYSNYSPKFTIYDTTTKTLTIIWGQRDEYAPAPLPEGKAAYQVSYLLSNNLNKKGLDLTEHEGQRTSEPADFEISESFNSYLSEHNPKKERLFADNAWQEKSSHFTKSQGALTSESWIRESLGTYLIFTETYSDYPMTFATARINRNLAIWDGLTIYQNILGAYFSAYSEAAQYTTD